MWSAKMDHKGARAATGSADFTAKVWNSVTGEEIKTLDHPHIVKSVDFSADDAFLATGCQDKNLRVYSLDRLDAAPEVYAHKAGVREVVWMGGRSASGAAAAAAGSSAVSASGSASAAASAGTGAAASPVSAAGHFIATGSEDGAVRLWDRRTHAAKSGAVAEVVIDKAAVASGGGAVMDLELSADGRTLTVAAGKTVAMLDAESLAVRHSHALPFAVECASLHPITGKHFVAGGSDVWAHVLETDTGKEVAVNKGHHGIIFCTRFAPDGATYATGADDATIRIWKFDA